MWDVGTDGPFFPSVDADREKSGELKVWEEVEVEMGVKYQKSYLGKN